MFDSARARDNVPPSATRLNGRCSGQDRLGNRAFIEDIKPQEVTGHVKRPTQGSRCAEVTHRVVSAPKFSVEALCVRSLPLLPSIGRTYKEGDAEIPDYRPTKCKGSEVMITRNFCSTIHGIGNRPNRMGKCGSSCRSYREDPVQLAAF